MTDPVTPAMPLPPRHSASRYWWAISVALAAIGLVTVTGLWIGVTSHGAPIGLDQAWHDVLAQHRVGAATTIALAFNFIGKPVVALIVLTMVVVVLLVFRRFRSATVLALSAALATGCSELLKYLVSRPRPLDTVIPEDAHSYPSGHATIAAVVAVVVALLLHRWWVWLVAVVWVLLMAASRTYLLVHWLSDTAAGALLGASVAVIVWCAVSLVLGRARTPRHAAPARPVSGNHGN